MICGEMVVHGPNTMVESATANFGVEKSSPDSQKSIQSMSQSSSYCKSI